MRSNGTYLLFLGLWNLQVTDIRRCVNAITVNSGQICFASSRVYVQEGIYDRFLEDFVEAMKAKTKQLGDPEVSHTSIGPVVDKAQFDRVMKIIDTAQEEKQGTLIMGGKVSGTKVLSHYFDGRRV